MGEMRLMVGSGWKTAMPFLGEYGFNVEAGDTKLIWDEEQDAEVANARRTFNDLRGRGYTAFAVKAGGERGTRVTEFDPAAESLILVPQMAGGANLAWALSHPLHAPGSPEAEDAARESAAIDAEADG